MKFLMLSSVAVMGLTTLSVAMGSVPSRSRVTDDTAIYQNLSEIRVGKEVNLNFDSDIARLSASEGQYREKLPALSQHPRLRAPMKRVAQQKYHRSHQQAGTVRE